MASAKIDDAASASAMPRLWPSHSNSMRVDSTSSRPTIFSPTSPWVEGWRAMTGSSWRRRRPSREADLRRPRLLHQLQAQQERRGPGDIRAGSLQGICPLHDARADPCGVRGLPRDRDARPRHGHRRFGRKTIQCPVMVIWGSNSHVGRHLKPIEAWTPGRRISEAGPLRPATIRPNIAPTWSMRASGPSSTETSRSPTSLEDAPNWLSTAAAAAATPVYNCEQRR